jgi:hypothetical protein
MSDGILSLNLIVKLDKAKTIPLGGTAVLQGKKGYQIPDTGYFIHTWIQSPV